MMTPLSYLIQVHLCEQFISKLLGSLKIFLLSIGNDMEQMLDYLANLCYGQETTLVTVKSSGIRNCSVTHSRGCEFQSWC